LICLAIVFYCKSEFYSLGLEQILVVGKTLSKFYLGLNTIMDGPYDIRTKEFYSLFYLFFPTYFLIGLISILFISPDRYKKMILGIKWVKMIFLTLLIVLILAPLPMLAPMIGFRGPTFLVLFNSILTAGIAYSAGAMLIASVIKFKFRRA
jgi:hypothetical protein